MNFLAFKNFILMLMFINVLLELERVYLSDVLIKRSFLGIKVVSVKICYFE